MHDESSKIGVVLAIAASSVLGLLSSRASEAESHSLRVESLTGLSAGVLLAVAWLHLLDDAQERLEGVTEYPAANAAMLTGFLIMAVLQTLTAPCHHAPTAAGCSQLEPLTSTGSGSEQQLRMFHVLEASISIHSVLIGLGFGLGELGDREQLVLGLALCVHQYLEGLTVGMLGRKSGLSQQAWRCSFLVFTLSLPLGVSAGVVVQYFYAGLNDNFAFRWCSGLLNGMAAGTLTHIGVHMINAHADEPPPRPPMPERVTKLLERPETPDSVTKFERVQPGCSRDQALLVMLGEPIAPKGLLERCVPPRAVLRMLAAGLGAVLMAILAIWA